MEIVRKIKIRNEQHKLDCKVEISKKRTASEKKDSREIGAHHIAQKRRSRQKRSISGISVSNAHNARVEEGKKLEQEPTTALAEGWRPYIGGVIKI